MSMKSKVVRKTRERSLNNRRQDACSQPRLQNGEDKRKHFIARFRCQLYSKWIYESLVTLLPGTCLEKNRYIRIFSSVDDNNESLVEIIEADR